MKAALVLLTWAVAALALPALAAPQGPGPGPGPTRSFSGAQTGNVLPQALKLTPRPAALPSSPPRPTDPIAARYSAGYDVCMHRAVSTLDMLDCGGKETERWDARLNRAYQARMTSLNDRQRGALKRAEKAWVAFRDADCAAYQDDDWGTISKIDASQCYLRRTVERTLELEAFPADHGPG